MAKLMKADPSRTTLLRRAFERDMNKRFRLLMRDVRELLVEDDAFGFVKGSPFIRNAQVPWQAWRFMENDKKLQAFQQWFSLKVDKRIFDVTAGKKPWMAKYVDTAHKKGVVRAYTDTRRADLLKTPEFYRGSREEFLRSAFAQPERISKVKMLSMRAFEELKGVTASMSGSLSRILAGGIAEGRHPRTLVKEIAAATGISRRRAALIARTEIIHAHAEGQLDGFEDLGVKEVGIKAEWLTAGDDKVCSLCADLEGRVFTIEEARGLIPRHPNCRCAWVPWIPGLPKSSLVRRKRAVAKKAKRKVIRKKVAKKKVVRKKVAKKPKYSPKERGKEPISKQRSDVEGSPVSSTYKTGADQRGVNQATIIELENGEKAIFKNERGMLMGRIEYEKAASVLDEQLGFGRVPATGIREVGKQGRGSVQLWKDNTTAGGDWFRGRDRIFKGREILSEKQLGHARQMTIEDFLMRNTDRHGQNWLVDKVSGDFYAIDNGIAFFKGSGGDWVGVQRTNAARSAVARKSNWAKSEIDGLKGFLRGLQQKKVRRDWVDLLDKVRVDELEARGKKILKLMEEVPNFGEASDQFLIPAFWE